jgi:hypothetical protein
VTISILLYVVLWIAAAIILSEALNKIHRTKLFAVDSTLRSRLAALRGAPTVTARLINRLKCFGWRIVSMRDRAAWLLHAGGWRSRLIDVLKLSAWVLLSVGAGGVLVSPFVGVPLQSAYVCTEIGFALLIVRTRVREVLKV